GESAADEVPAEPAANRPGLVDVRERQPGHAVAAAGAWTILAESAATVLRERRVVAMPERLERERRIHGGAGRGGPGATKLFSERLYGRIRGVGGIEQHDIDDAADVLDSAFEGGDGDACLHHDHF